MKTSAALKLLSSLTTSVLVSTIAGYASEDPPAGVRKFVDSIVQPVMERHDVPGLAVGITIDGEHHFFNYGLAS